MDDDIFIIAEVGVNHNGSLALAMELIDIASDAGADAVKFQSFCADELSTKHAKQANYQKINTGKEEAQLNMLRRLELSHDDMQKLHNYSRKKKIEFMSSPFDIKSFNFLNSIGMEKIKIPSGEITNKPMLIEIAKQNKETFISTGMSTLEEIESTFQLMLESGLNKENISFLQCTSDYPAKVEDSNINVIKKMKEHFNVRVGYSDHTDGHLSALLALAAGATIFEKHFTIDREMDGPDHRASMEPKELKDYIVSLRTANLAMGSGIKKPSVAEEMNKRIVRKSIVASKKISKGETFSRENISCKRPGEGISPMEIDNIYGKKSSKDYLLDEMISLDELNNV